MKKDLGRVVFLCGIVFSLLYTNAFAEGISKGGKMELGVKNVGVWISPDCEYTVSIPRAIENWEYPGWWNPVNMSIVESKKWSTIDFYQEYTPYSNVNAYTAYYYSDGSALLVGESETNNWRYTKIHLNESNMGNRPSYKNVATIIHEIGHAFGLNHVSSKYSIMYAGDDRYVYKVTKDANDAIVNKYR